MISVPEAESLVLENTPDAPVVSLPLEQGRGEILREPIRADRPFPPFHRVAMDGIAIQFTSWQEGAREFPVAGVQRAGEAQAALTDAGACYEVMTGAMLPTGCDCVIPVENLELQNGTAKLVSEEELEPMQNIHQLGSDRDAGDALLEAGTVLFGPQCAVAATVGAAAVKVGERPSIAIVSTGDELVDVSEDPEPHQIRRSNSYALRSLLAGAGFEKTTMHHFRDDPDAIESGLAQLLESSRFILVSGGVSAGRFDYVPEVLKRLRVEQVFHKVSQRPGKPLWFGMGPGGQAVFGLPGNPVSGVVCCSRFVLPALWKSLGAKLRVAAERPQAILETSVRFGKALTLFKPVTIDVSADGGRTAKPVAMGGSGDLAGLSDSDGFVELAAEQDEFEAGTSHTVWSWADPYLQLWPR